MTPRLTYLAAPYSHPDPKVRRIRFNIINRVAAELMAKGELVFSPISHTHPIALAGDLPLGWDYWETYARAILQCCREMKILRLTGWEQSIGIQNERRIAFEMQIPIEFIDP